MTLTGFSARLLVMGCFFLEPVCCLDFRYSAFCKNTFSMIFGLLYGFEALEAEDTRDMFRPWFDVEYWATSNLEFLDILDSLDRLRDDISLAVFFLDTCNFKLVLALAPTLGILASIDVKFLIPWDVAFV